MIYTLRTSWEDLQGFLGIFFLVFFAFVQLFYMLLHHQLEDFSNIVSAFETCFTMMLSKFDFGPMRDISMTAAVMFFFYVVATTWILINVLLTIIIDAFENVKTDIEEQDNDYEIWEFIKYRVKDILGLEMEDPVNVLSKDVYKYAEKPIDDQPNDDEEEEEEKIEVEEEISDDFSILDESGHLSEVEEDPVALKNETNITNLPDKVDTFLQYINHLYFGGDLRDPKAIVKPNPPYVNTQRKIIISD